MSRIHPQRTVDGVEVSEQIPSCCIGRLSLRRGALLRQHYPRQRMRRLARLSRRRAI